jgi:histidinol-phosphatase
LDSKQLLHRLEVGRAAAAEAGRLTLEYFRKSDLAVERKSDTTPVTVADREAERLLRAQIAAAFPDDGILGEEFPDSPGISGYRWILDPIDGTKSFIHGVPLYGTLIGMEHDSKSVLGIICLPALDECIYAAKGHGAWYVRGEAAPVAARVSPTGRLADSLFCTTSVKSFATRRAMPIYERLQSATRLSRTWGDCYGYMLVATGRAELMIDPAMNVWDAAAILPILEEAGGTFTDWQGRATIHSGEGIATNGLVLEEVLAITRTAQPLADQK